MISVVFYNYVKKYLFLFLHSFIFINEFSHEQLYSKSLPFLFSYTNPLLKIFITFYFLFLPTPHSSNTFSLHLLTPVYPSISPPPSLSLSLTPFFLNFQYTSNTPLLHHRRRTLWQSWLPMVVAVIIDSVIVVFTTLLLDLFVLFAMQQGRYIPRYFCIFSLFSIFDFKYLT